MSQLSKVRHIYFIMTSVCDVHVTCHTMLPHHHNVTMALLWHFHSSTRYVYLLFSQAVHENKVLKMSQLKIRNMAQDAKLSEVSLNRPSCSLCVYQVADCYTYTCVAYMYLHRIDHSSVRRITCTLTDELLGHR